MSLEQVLGGGGSDGAGGTEESRWPVGDVEAKPDPGPGPEDMEVVGALTHGEDGTFSGMLSAMPWGIILAIGTFIISIIALIFALK